MPTPDPPLARVLRWGVTVWLIALIWALFPYTREPTGPIKELVLRVGAAVLFSGSLAASLLHARSPDFDRTRESASLPVLAGLLLLAFALSLTQAVNVGYSLYIFSGWASYVAALNCARYAYRSAAQAWRTFAIVSCATIVTSLYGFVQFAGLDPVAWDAAIAETYDTLRQGPSTFGNPNYASHALLLIGVTSAAWAIRTRRWYAWIPVAVFALHFALTRTRGSLLAAGCAVLLIAIALLLRRATKRTQIATAATLLITSSALIALVALGIAYSWHRFASPIPHDATVSIRVQTLAGATEMIREKPLLGRGPGGYAIENPNYWTETEQRRFAELGMQNQNAHCDPIEVAINAGLIGAALYLALLVFGLWHALSFAFTGADRDTRILGYAAAAVIGAFLVDGLFGFPAHTPVAGAFVFMLLGMLSGLTPNAAIGSRETARSRWFGRFALCTLGWVTAIAIILFAARDFMAEVFQQRGRIAHGLGYSDESTKALMLARRLAPYHWQTPYLMGNDAMARQRPERALEFYADAIRLNPGYVYAYVEAARVHLHIATSEVPNDSLTYALAYADGAARINPLLPEVHDLVGRALILQAQSADSASLWSEAEQKLLRAESLSRMPSAQRLLLIAQTRQARGDLDGTKKALVAALEADPDRAQTWTQVATLASDTSDYRLLLDAVDWRLDWLTNAGTTAGAEYAGLYRYKATALAESGHTPDEVHAAFKSAIDASPLDPITWESLIDYALANDQLPVFETEIQRMAANRAQSNEELPYALHAAAIAADGDWAGAIAQLDRDLQRTWPIAERAHVEAGLRVSAKYLETIATRDSIDQPSDSLIIGQAYLSGNEPDSALRVIEAALESIEVPKQVDALHRIATAHTLKGDTAAAVESLERALALNQGRLDTRLALAAAYAAAGQASRSSLEYQYVLSLLPPNDPLRARIEEEMARLTQ